MVVIAKNLEEMGYVLRSGGAIGADSAFERGVLNPDNMRIYSPNMNIEVSEETWKKSVDIALSCHPNPAAAMKYIRWIGRNPFQVLGDDLKTPSEFLVCWTKNAKDVGGTGTTIRIAKKYNVPVLNLFDTPRDKVIEFARKNIRNVEDIANDPDSEV